MRWICFCCRRYREERMVNCTGWMSIGWRRGWGEGVGDGSSGGLERGWWSGGLEVEGGVGSGLVGLDHREVWMKVKLLGGGLMVGENKKGRVDWGLFKARMRLEDRWESWLR